MAIPSGHSCALEMSAFFGAGEAGCDYVTHNSEGLAFDKPLISLLSKVGENNLILFRICE